MVTINIPSEYGYVILTAIAAWSVLAWQTNNVGKARKKYKVFYPKMYADDESETGKIFNCIQRVNQNTFEIFPSFIVFHLLAGIKFPIFTSICGIVWITGRIKYSLGYYSGNPQKRIGGLFGHLGHFAIVLLLIYWGLQLLGALP